MTAVWMPVAVALGAAVVVFYFMPDLTRREIYFGVTVPGSLRETGQGRAVRRGYRRAVAIHGGVAAALLVAGVAGGMTALSPVAIAWLIGGALAAFLRARSRVQPHACVPTPVREATLVSFSGDGMPGGLIGQLGPFALLAGAAALLLAWADRLPGDGLAEGLAALAGGGLTVGVLLVFGRGLASQTHRVHAVGDAARTERRFRRATLAVLLASEYLVAFTTALAVLAPLGGGGPAVVAVIASVLSAALVVVVVVVLVRMGQGGERLEAPTVVQGRPVGDRTLDQYWRWGIFYVNRDDPALFIEKRFGIGYTINLGNPRAWLLLGVVLLVVVGTSLAGLLV